MNAFSLWFRYQAISQNHIVPRTFAAVGDHMQGVYAKLQELNTRLEDALDAQDKFTSDVEKLCQTVISCERRLAKVAGVWLKSSSTFNLPSSTTNVVQLHAIEMEPVERAMGMSFSSSLLSYLMSPETTWSKGHVF